MFMLMYNFYNLGNNETLEISSILLMFKLRQSKLTKS